MCVCGGGGGGGGGAFIFMVVANLGYSRTKNLILGVFKEKVLYIDKR